MGLLDDAIREHLDLKRRSGGDPTEIERLEREALGPVRREPSPSIYTGPSADEREPEPDFSQARVTGAIQDVHDHDPLPHEPIEAIPPSYDERHAFDPRGEEPGRERDAPVREEPPHKKRRFLRGLSALSGAPAEDEHDDYDPIQPVQSERPAPVAPGPAAPSPAEAASESASPAQSTRPQSAPPRPSEPPRLTLSGESHQDPEPPTGSAPAVPDAREREPEPDLPTDEQATQVHRVVQTESAAPAQSAAPASPAVPAEPPAPRPADEADPLEETPEFLQDAPEHDRLWFEQRPPRDFDFDG